MFSLNSHLAEMGLRLNEKFQIKVTFTCQFLAILMLRFTPRAYWWAIPWACLSQVRLVEHNPFPLPGHAHLGKPRWIGTASSPNLGESTSGEVKGSRGKRLLKSVSISNNFTAVDPSVLKFLIHLHPAPHPLIASFANPSRNIARFVGEIHSVCWGNSPFHPWWRD